MLVRSKKRFSELATEVVRLCVESQDILENGKPSLF
jgi:hypothetical protein